MKDFSIFMSLIIVLIIGFILIITTLDGRLFLGIAMVVGSITTIIYREARR